VFGYNPLLVDDKTAWSSPKEGCVHSTVYGAVPPVGIKLIAPDPVD
jgi:hypothetical protein